MTPIERIQRNKGLQDFAHAQENPVAPAAAFPRNTLALTLLLVAATPLLFKALSDPTLTNITAYGTLTAGFGAALWLLALGLKTEALYDAAPVARAPKRPLKLMGIALFGAASAGLAWFNTAELPLAAAVLVVTSALALVTFGRDPGAHKGFETVRQRQSHRLDDATARVGKQMERIREAASIHGDRDVMPAVRAMDDAVDALLRAAINNPDRLSSLRKFFGIYLESAAEAAERFAAVYSGTGDLTSKQKYLALLEKLETAFSAKAHEYAAAGQINFDVEHDVLGAALDAELKRLG